MTIIDCLFYAFDSLSHDVLLENIAKLVVVWLYFEILPMSTHKRGFIWASTREPVLEGGEGGFANNTDQPAHLQPAHLQCLCC